MKTRPAHQVKHRLHFLPLPWTQHSGPRAQSCRVSAGKGKPPTRASSRLDWEKAGGQAWSQPHAGHQPGGLLTLCSQVLSSGCSVQLLISRLSQDFVTRPGVTSRSRWSRCRMAFRSFIKLPGGPSLWSAHLAQLYGKENCYRGT